jgi:DNA-binding transcriptional MerR regulator
MDKKQALKSTSKKEYLTLSELVVEVARIIPYIASEQKSDRVAVYPDERTIRYYINEGLVDKPHGEKGQAKTFHYKHLLQVLTIKYLQAQFIPLNEIKELLKKIDENQMEELLTEEKNAVIPGILGSMGAAVGLIPPIAGILGFLGTSYLLKKKADTKKDQQPKTPARWLRVPISDKVELNIQEDYLPEDEDKDEFIDRLVARMRIYLQGEESKRRDEK